MASGEPVPNEIVDDLIAEAMLRVAEGSDVIYTNLHMNTK